MIFPAEPIQEAVHSMTTPIDSDRNHGLQRAVDELEIRALHARLLEAWNEGDAEAFASPFSDDAYFVPFDGSVLVGRERIAAAHQPLFDRWLKGSRLVDEHTEVRFLGDDVALVLAVGGTVMRGKSKPAPARDSIQTLIAIREAGHDWDMMSRRVGLTSSGGATPCDICAREHTGVDRARGICLIWTSVKVCARWIVQMELARIVVKLI